GVELPREALWPAAPATAVLAGRGARPGAAAPAGRSAARGAASPAARAATPGRLDLAALARVLHLSAGVVRTSERADGRLYHFRAAGSAGGRFPLELYVAARAVHGLPDGVHWYDPIGHALRQVGPAPAGAAT